MKTKNEKKQTGVYFFIMIIILLFACNSTNSKIDRINEIDKKIKELQSKTTIDDRLESIDDFVELEMERDKLIEELKQIDKSKLTPEQISIIYKEDKQFDKLFSEGKKYYNDKQYAPAVESFDKAKALSIQNDSFELYYDAARVYLYSEALKSKNQSMLSSDVDTISKLIIQLPKISLIKEFEKENLKKDLIDYRDYYFITVYSSTFDVTKENGIFQYKNQYDLTKKRLLELKKADSLYDIFTNNKIKKIYNQIENVNTAAYLNLLTYGQPSLVDLEVASKLYLEKTMNDPESLEIVEKEAFATQYNKGYTYKMKIRGSNAFGATITQVKTFYCLYDLNSQSYYCETSY
jgi:hypothetical protein